MFLSLPAPSPVLPQVGAGGLEGLRQLLGLLLPALGAALLGGEEACQVIAGAAAAGLQLEHAGVQAQLLQAVLLLHLGDLGREGGQSVSDRQTDRERDGQRNKTEEQKN